LMRITKHMKKGKRQCHRKCGYVIAFNKIILERDDILRQLLNNCIPVLLLYLLVGCANSHEIMPLEEISVHDNFTMTVSSPQSVWCASEITENNPLVFEVSLVYHGDKPEVHAYHRLPFYSFGVKFPSGEGNFSNTQLDKRVSTAFRYGEPYVWSFKWHEKPIVLEDYEVVWMPWVPIKAGNLYFMFSAELRFECGLPDFDCIIWLPFSIV